MAFGRSCLSNPRAHADKNAWQVRCLFLWKLLKLSKLRFWIRSECSVSRFYFMCSPWHRRIGLSIRFLTGCKKAINRILSRVFPNFLLSVVYSRGPLCVAVIFPWPFCVLDVLLRLLVLRFYVLYYCIII